MRWLVVSDLHYGLRQFDWVSQVAGDFDLVAIAGDLLDLRSVVPIEAQSVAVRAQIARIGRRGTLVACSGNHDLDDRDKAGEKTAHWLQAARSETVHVDGDSLVLGDVLITVCPWWDGPVGRQELEDRLTADSGRGQRSWVWIYHAPPSGSRLAWDGRREFGDEVVSEWITRFQPDFVLSGHIHQSPFTADGGWSERIGRTWVFNPGRQPGAVPAHIVIDHDAGLADWFSIEGAESVALDRDALPTG